MARSLNDPATSFILSKSLARALLPMTVMPMVPMVPAVPAVPAVIMPMVPVAVMPPSLFDMAKGIALGNARIN